MRVLYLSMNPNRTSTTVPTEGWIRCLRPKGLAPVLVSHRWGPFSDWAAAEGVPTYGVSLPAPSKSNPFPFFFSLAKLYRIVRKHKIQLIHCNEQDIYPIGNYLARICRIPVVVSVHFTMEPEYCRWAFGGKRLPDRIFFISPGNLAACRAAVENVIPESRWRVLFNGLDLEKFAPNEELRHEFRQQHRLTDKIVIGVACALRPRKQIEHLFEAVSRLEQPNVTLVLAGGPIAADQAYAEQLLDHGRTLLRERFVHVGKLSDLRSFYCGLDLFVNTSQEEACSISVLEALASGCPVIGYASKSVDGQVLPGGGEIVPQDDVEALTCALRRWIDAPELRQAGRDGARRRAEEAFDIRKLADQLWHEYQQVLDGHA